MERIINLAPILLIMLCIAVVFVLLLIWALRKAVMYESLFHKAEARRIVLEEKCDTMAKDLYLWQHRNQEIIAKDDEEVKWLSLPYPIIHRELLEMRPKFIVRRENDLWNYEFIGAAVFAKVISNTEKDGYQESWVRNNEISIEEYQQQLNLKP